MVSVYPFSSHQMLEIWRKSQIVAHLDTCDVICTAAKSTLIWFLTQIHVTCPRSATGHCSNTAEIKHCSCSTAVKCNHLCLQYSPPSHRSFSAMFFRRKFQDYGFFMFVVRIIISSLVFSPWRDFPGDNRDLLKHGLKSQTVLSASAYVLPSFHQLPLRSLFVLLMDLLPQHT